MLYPLKLKPIFKERIWGGQHLAQTFGYKLPVGAIIGEVWLLASHPHGSNVIENGHFAGITLANLMAQHGRELVGPAMSSKSFPLLVKLLDAGACLSVQVHPDNTFAVMHEQECGKNELWVILAAKPDAEIVYGLKPGIDAASFSEAVRKGTGLDSYLNRIMVKPGDVFFIPAGMLHSLGKDILAAEIQDNSDVTYRVFDYGRLDRSGQPRKLNINKALKVIDLAKPPCQTVLPFSGPTFRVERLTISDKFRLINSDEALQFLLVLKGIGKLTGKGTNLLIRPGDALVIPASVAGVTLTGTLELLKGQAVWPAQC